MKALLKCLPLCAALPLLCLFVSCASNVHFKQGWNAQYSFDADGHYNSGIPPDYDRAIREYTAALENNEPALLFIHYCRGLVYLFQGDVEKTEADFAELLRDYGNYYAEVTARSKYHNPAAMWLNVVPDIKKIMRGATLNNSSSGSLYAFVTGRAFYEIAEIYRKESYYGNVVAKQSPARAAFYYEAHIALHPDDQEAKDTLSEVTRLAAVQEEAEKKEATKVKVAQPSPAAPAQPQVPSQAVDAYNRGEEAHYRKNAFDEAIAEYNEAIRLDPDYADAYLGRGNAYSSNDNGEQARADYDRAAQLDSKYAGFARAFGAHMDEDYDKAIEEYTLAIRNRINLVVAYNNRGACYYNLGIFDDAIADYTESIRLSPELYVPYLNRAYIYYQTEAYDKALPDYDTVIRLAPDVSAISYSIRGEIHVRRGDNTRALADYNQAIKLDPKYVAAYSNRAYTHVQNGDLDQAISDISEAIKLTADDNTEGLVLYFNNRAYLYDYIEEYAKALADYDEVLRLDPDNDGAKGGRRRVQAKLSSQ